MPWLAQLVLRGVIFIVRRLFWRWLLVSFGRALVGAVVRAPITAVKGIGSSLGRLLSRGRRPRRAGGR